jgi:hypothetical protein
MTLDGSCSLLCVKGLEILLIFQILIYSDLIVREVGLTEDLFGLVVIFADFIASSG